MNYWLIFLTGLTTGGLTCAAMQGGLLASLIANQKKEQVNKGFGLDDWGPVTAFLSTKLVSHIILGALLGLLGSVVELSLNLRLAFQAFAAFFMFSTAMNLLEVHPIFRYVCLTPPKFIYKFIKKDHAASALFGPAVFGLLTVFIPCGVTQAMAVLAINSGSWIQGSLIMGSFVLGTIPMFSLIGIGTAKLSEVWRRDFLRIASIVLIVMALQSVNVILTVLNSPYSLQRIGPKIVRLLPPYEKTTANKGTDPNVKVEDGTQKVTLTVQNNGYSPRYFRVKSGTPVELTLATNGDVYSCATAFTFKAFDIYDVLKPVDTKVHKFTPSKVGLYTFSCSMGMYSGTMEVI
jgi:sulfite exporter TauE/SafE